MGDEEKKNGKILWNFSFFWYWRTFSAIALFRILDAFSVQDPRRRQQNLLALLWNLHWRISSAISWNASVHRKCARKFFAVLGAFPITWRIPGARSKNASRHQKNASNVNDALSDVLKMPPPPKPLSFEMPKPPVLQPNVSEILKKNKASESSERHQIPNPFAPRPSSVSPVPKKAPESSQKSASVPPSEVVKVPEDKIQKPVTLDTSSMKTTEIPITPIVEDAKEVILGLL